MQVRESLLSFTNIDESFKDLPKNEFARSKKWQNRRSFQVVEMMRQSITVASYQYINTYAVTEGKESADCFWENEGPILDGLVN